MLKIDRKTKHFSNLEKPTLSEVSISERYDLQEFICRTPKEFFGEIGEKLFLIGKEITPSETVQDRIDILALDREGQAVIIELKRSSHKLHLLQAISYAGMVSRWQPIDFTSGFNDDKIEELVKFLDVEQDEINRQQRIILVAEGFDYSALIGVEWLAENFGVSIACCQIAVEIDAPTKTEFMSCSSIYPNPELTQHSVQNGKKRKPSIAKKWQDWDSALDPIENQAVSEFFHSRVAAKQENNLHKRILTFRVNEKKRVDLTANNKQAYGWQHGRFHTDIETWKSALSKSDDVSAVNDGKSLRFFLHTENDFREFDRVVKTVLPDVEWIKGPLDIPDDNTDE